MPTTTASSPVPAPPTPATVPRAPGTTVPAPQTADPDVDWAEVANILIPPGRTVLEVMRFIPGWGGVAGMASDVAGAYSDLTSVPQNETGELVSDLVLTRSVITVANGALGHLLYVNQLVQDGLAGSIVGAEFTPFTAGVNETLSMVKIFLDVGTGMVDILVEAGALYGRDHATSPAEAEQWQGLVEGYAANLAGDVLGLIMDMISLGSLGAANTGPAQEVARIFNTSGAILKQWGPNLIALFGGIWNVWGGEAVKRGGEAVTRVGEAVAPALDTGTPTPMNEAAPVPGQSTAAGAPVNAQALADGSPIQRVLGDTPAVVRLLAEATALDAAGDIVDLNAPQARVAYDSVNAVIDLLAEYMDEKMGEIDAVVMAIGDGRTSFQLIRDAVASSIDLLNEKLSMVTELVTIAGNGEAITLQVQEYCDGAIASIDAIQMPNVQIPEVDLGDGILADAAEGLANSAAGLANEQLAALVATVASTFESAKAELKTPIEEVRGKAEGFGEFLQNVAEVGSNQMGVISGHLATFSQGLSRCENIEQVINLIIGQISAITGVPSFTVEDLRDLWGGVGVAIDQFAGLGPQLHASAGVVRSRAQLIADGEEMEDEDAPQAAPPVGAPV